MASKHVQHTSGFLGRFARDERGVSAIIFAMILPLLIGMVGIAIEIGLWFEQKRDMQSAADAAAIAGAFEISEGNSDATMETSGKSSSALNGYTHGIDGVTVVINRPPDANSAHDGDSNYVQAVVQRPQTLLFSADLNPGAVTLIARATAYVGAQALGCVVALEPSASEAVHLDSNARINLTDCGLTVDSSSSTAVHMDSNSQVNADFARITGNYDLDSNATFNSTPVTTGATAVSDPFSDLANPSAGSCDQSGYSLGSNNTATLSPGVYCNGFSLGSNSRVTLSPGTYYMNNGTFSMSSNSKLYAGGGVTIIFTGSAHMDLSSNAWIQINAPTSGTYAGIAMMQDPDSSANTHTMNSNVYIGLTGAIYFPDSLLHMDSNSTITTSAVLSSGYATTTPASNSANSGCGLVVTDTLHMDSNSRINLNNDSATCDTYSVPTTTSGGTPTLVE